MLVSVLSGCSKPPEYSEIEARFKELVEASSELNEILFGEGLPVYERVYEPEIEVYREEETGKVYYYYEINDSEKGKIIAHKTTEYLYFTASDTKKDGVEAVYEADGKFYYKIEYNGMEDEKKVTSYTDKTSGKIYYFYVIENQQLGKIYEFRQQTVNYVKVNSEKQSDKDILFTDKNTGKNYYITEIEYSEPEYDFYYSEDDPDGYSFVRHDSEYLSVESIKEYAESVYSTSYLEGIYEMLFTGAVVSEDSAQGSLGARYMDYQDDEGTVWLMESDSYKSLIKDRRVYDFSTAKVVKPGNKKFVNIEIESYLEKEPEKRLKMKLSMVKQNDGQWYLDSATY